MSSTNPPKIDLAALQEDLKECLQRYETAAAQESIARNTKTAALNRLNQAQKELDVAIEVLKKGTSPWNSEWWSQRQRPVQAKNALGCIEVPSNG